ncbi:hypothetical protein FPV67DRAFT_1448214 [Lyophyllum atratum]|nr:hypothetical protein FPV67DRAFT_1448214 [Lyophyllum atratum]
MSQSWAITGTAIQPASTKLDIHDASRAKIVIRPRCKEYVKKQRLLKRTLACFTSVRDPAAPLSSKPSDPPSSISSPKTSSHASQKVNGKSVTVSTKAGGVNANSRSGKSCQHKSATPKVADGRIEKKAKCTKPSFVTIGEKTQARASHPVRRYDCTCLDPAQCTRCRILALADRFCAIVVAQEQRLEMYASTKSKQPFLKHIN